MIYGNRMLSLAATLVPGLLLTSALGCNKNDPPQPAAATAESQQPETRAAETTSVKATSAPAAESASLETVHASLSVYEDLRAQLARDDITVAVGTAAKLEQAAKEAGTKAPEKLRSSLAAVETAAGRLKQTSKEDASAVRRAFGEVSQAVVALLSAEPSLRQGRYIFECPMAQGYKKWVQTSEPISNPYMGTRMPTCGSQIEWGNG